MRARRMSAHAASERALPIDARDAAPLAKPPVTRAISIDALQVWCWRFAGRTRDSHASLVSAYIGTTFSGALILSFFDDYRLLRLSTFISMIDAMFESRLACAITRVVSRQSAWSQTSRHAITPRLADWSFNIFDALLKLARRDWYRHD